MEHLEEQAMNTAPSKPNIWKRFVDDIFAIVKRQHHKELLAHLNSQHRNITFTTEEETNGQLPFMDALVCRQPNGTLNFKVFRKPTHTGKYLAFDSHHPSSNKKSVLCSLFSRANKISSNSTDQTAENRIITKHLQENGYPTAFIKRNFPRPKGQEPTTTDDTEQRTKPITASIPFVDGTSQAIARILSELGIKTIQRPRTWKWALQRRLKDATDETKKPGLVYKLECNDCDLTYIGETGRNLPTRIKEHKAGVRNKHPNISAAAEHSILLNHQLDWDHPHILTHETHTRRRRIKEALAIHSHKTMNRDTGLELSKLWLNLVKTCTPKLPNYPT